MSNYKIVNGIIADVEIEVHELLESRKGWQLVGSITHLVGDTVAQVLSRESWGVVDTATDSHRRSS